LPGEKIVAVGQPADAMYFIAAGDVTVLTAFGPVVLKEGDFFGEMGLLESRPRNADVVADGYCHLLSLHRKEFDGLLAGRPEIRSQIEAVAAKRLGENTASAPAKA
jgi:CPA1 family monovalent cation:H+ antiporter